ncbi:hypothetical protein AGMMS50262_09920 [Bacteroidia bacterium]|nr:hypothetical protein AGMMS50262_09920 [Bacteroidia bacterium]
MFKRWISILLIFTVNVLFLTHTVIPHHHHAGVPHFTLFADGHHDRHDGCCHHDGEATCLLDKPIDVINETHIHSPLFLQAVLFTFTYNITVPDTDETFRKIPYLISYTQDFVGQNCGLRAPPTF